MNNNEALYINGVEIKSGTIVAFDFDGTLSRTTHYPECGEPIEKIVKLAKLCKAKGATNLLCTCRENENLQKAKVWCEMHRVPIDYYNQNVPEKIAQYGECRKLGYDILIDDRAINPTNIIEF